MTRLTCSHNFFTSTSTTLIVIDKVLKKEMQENPMKWRPLPAIPGNNTKRKKRKIQS
jgi:hypothetical protein